MFSLGIEPGAFHMRAKYSTSKPLGASKEREKGVYFHMARKLHTSLSTHGIVNKTIRAERVI